ncbi:unnamed protein product [Oikopleura dioica]|uniref:EF-hand domain-containing protein n=1 Tax=Oikopleura dioica TaxID=34765 RepID=E4WZ78_OIKDI|nr:unnamed protein product [Oikopleura dioica]CBY22473.1 unnamed protein product [Oikopleura dioica]
MNKPLTHERLLEYREAFQLFDKDGNGTIEIDELKIVLSSLGQPATQEELEELMKLADIDGDGTIDLDEFIEMMRVQDAMETENSHEETLRETFQLFDTDGSGKISSSELKQVMEKLGDHLTDSQIQAMIKEADADGDGEIDFEEFVRMVSC